MTRYGVPGWRAAGACVSTDPDLFFPVSASGTAAVQAERALRICAACRVRQPCLDFAVEHGETDGIWGGTTPEQRTRARRAASASRRRGQAAVPQTRTA